MKKMIFTTVLFVLIYCITYSQNNFKKNLSVLTCPSPSEMQKAQDKKLDVPQSIINKVELIKKQKLQDWGVTDERFPGPILQVPSQVLHDVEIPVIVHVVHHGEPLGEYSNVSEENINFAIQHLNHYFNNTLPSPLGPTINISFCLATVDELGNPLVELGIERIKAEDSWIDSSPASGSFYPPNSTQEQIQFNTIENIVKPQTIWDPREYLNIWTINAPLYYGSGQLFGYAKFPSSPSLPGIDLPPNDLLGSPSSLTTMTQDGVVMMSSLMTSVEFGATPSPVTASYPFFINYQIGDVLVHEVGHWLGLRHVTGDGNCSVDDNCEDTERCSNLNGSCSTAPQCGYSTYPVENFMSYTLEDCQDEFTPCQRKRMSTALINDPMRRGLFTSEGCRDPGCFIYPEFDHNYVNDAELYLSDASEYITGGTIIYSKYSVTDLTTGNTTFTASFGGLDPPPITIVNGNLVKICQYVVVQDYLGRRCRASKCDTIRLCDVEPIFLLTSQDLPGAIDVTLTNTSTGLPSNYTISYDVTISYDDCGETNDIYTGDVVNFTAYENHPSSGAQLTGILITMTITNITSGCVNTQTYGVGGDCYGNTYYPDNPLIPGAGGRYASKESSKTSFFIKQKKSDLKLYPNPASDIIYLEGIGDIQSFMIFDTQGKQFNVHLNKEEINISSLSNGVYWLRVITEKGDSYNKKFIKLR